MEFVGTGERLTEADYLAGAARLSCPVSRIHALVEVETNGRGFDSRRRPRILFERHKFYRNVPASKRQAAINAGLAASTWGGYGKESEQYPKLERAIAIDEDAGLKSCSWGLGQVLGENYSMIGRPSVQAMVEEAKLGEGEQLLHMLDFIEAAGLSDELRAGNWRGVARGYNGAAYAKHNYHGRLATADAKHAWRNDMTPAPASPDVVSDDPARPVLRLGADGLAVSNLQRILVGIGFVIDVDSDFGPQTRKAVRIFQGQRGMKVDGIVGPITWAQLDKALAEAARTGEPKPREVVEGVDYPAEIDHGPEHSEGLPNGSVPRLVWWLAGLIVIGIAAALILGR